MKNYLLLALALFLFSFSNAQDYNALQLNEADQTVTIQRIVETNGTKENLHKVAQNWVLTVLENTEIRLSDVEGGTIVARGFVLCPFSPVLTALSDFEYSEGDFIDFTMQIDVKDNKARLTFKDHRIERLFWSVKGREKTGFRKYKRRVDETFDALMVDFEIAMKDMDVIDDDWE